MRLNFLIGLIIAALLMLQYRLWFQADGMREMLVMKKNLRAQVKLNEQLKLQNETLLFQIKRLQSSQDAAESRARNELGMIKKGETFYQVVR